MELLTAKEAREITDASNTELVDILNQIKEQAIMGGTSIVAHNVDGIKVQLISRGFCVEKSDKYDYIGTDLVFHEISW